MKGIAEVFKYSVAVLFILTSQAILAQVAEKAEDISPLLVGEKIPEAMLFDWQGQEFNLSKIIESKPTVLIFYRGGWCPYCNAQLAGLVQVEQKVIDAGYQIVAISPDPYKELVDLTEKHEIKYQLFSDPDAKLIRAMGLAFSSGSSKGILPVPALLVINTAGEILFEHINPNFRKRIEPDYLMAVLKALKL